jgi:hypothetical protein
MIQKVKQMTNKWIKWDGGECPVDGETYVYIKCRDTPTYLDHKAKRLDWTHSGEWSDIIAYRLSAEEN